LSRSHSKYYIKRDDDEHNNIIIHIILYCNLPISSPVELPLTTDDGYDDVRADNSCNSCLSSVARAGHEIYNMTDRDETANTR